MVRKQRNDFVDSTCCFCGTPTKAELVYKDITLTMTDSKETVNILAIEWCPECERFNLLKKLPDNHATLLKEGSSEASEGSGDGLSEAVNEAEQ